MTSEKRGRELIQELLVNPRKFAEEGRSYALLQTYFDGSEPETLRPLLRSSDVWTQRVAAFVASELGARALPLVPDVLPLLNSSDPFTQNYAMEVLSVCGDDEAFALVATKLESAHQGIRLQAMSLLANASGPQLRAASTFFRSRGNAAHARGLRILANDQAAGDSILQALRASESLVQRYAAIAVKRFRLEGQELQEEAARSLNSDVREFLTEAT